MKTHALAAVTLGMKNLVGVFPGTEYCSVRACMHDLASRVEPSGTAASVVDMVRANKLRLADIEVMETDPFTIGYFMPVGARRLSSSNQF